MNGSQAKSFWTQNQSRKTGYSWKCKGEAYNKKDFDNRIDRKQKKVPGSAGGHGALAILKKEETGGGQKRKQEEECEKEATMRRRRCGAAKPCSALLF